MSNRKVVKTIDITPTWEAVTKTYFMLLRDQPNNKVVLDNAESEMIRLAQAYDKLTEKCKDVVRK